MRWIFVALALAVAVPVKAETASELIGRTVYEAGGDAAGRVSDFVVDARSGAIRFLLLERGGVLGIGGEEAAVSTGELSVQDGELRLRTPARTLEYLPAFGRLTWPAMRASMLLGHEVVDRRHRDAGELVDLVVDLGAGRVRAAVLDLRDDWKVGELRVSVDFQSLSLPRDLGRYIALNIDRDRLTP